MTHSNQEELDQERGLTHSQQEAFEFTNSIRGQYILSQALYYAIKVMESMQPESLQETSNIADMRYIREKALPLFIAPEEMRDLADELDAQIASETETKQPVSSSGEA